MKHFSKINFLFFIIACLLLVILIFTLYNDRVDNRFYCGVTDPPIIQETISVEQASIPGYEKGSILFKQNCKSCHKIHEESVGPALSGVTQRRPKKWIYAFIQNSTKLIKKKDTMAVNLYNRYNKAQMTSFPTLTKAEIDSILIYIEAIPVPGPAVMYYPEIRPLP